MAYLKLGYALLDRGDLSGSIYIQQARNILVEIEKLQTVDPNGGLLYAASHITGTSDFPQAPSAAGTTWLLMVQQTIEEDDKIMRDAFWGPDQGLIYHAAIAGPTAGLADKTYTFTIVVGPLSALQPITYVWHIAEQSPVTHTSDLSDTVTFTWDVTGPQAITVTATNSLNTVFGIQTITIHDPGIAKVVTPQGQVNYGDELTYTLVISDMRGAQVALYDPLDGTTFVRLVTSTTGITHDNGIIAGTLMVTPTDQITVSFVVKVETPGTAGWTITVTNSACVIPLNGTLGNCIWSNEVSNPAFRPYKIYLPVMMRD